VNDLAQAHMQALESLLAGGRSDVFNVGTGSGYSVREVVRAVEAATGKKVPFAIGPRREGDPPELVADSTKLRRTLQWTPRYSELRNIVDTAWNFEQQRKPREAPRS
jgi:UDP-glucose 4-epimerase/UDP-arabinose 4-epimerase